MAASVFISYSHKDEDLRDELEVQLAMLKRQGLIDVWHDRRMLAGDKLDWTISKELDAADIVLLLVSPDFLASDYCYKIEKARALERHNQGSARLISVILRPCDWKHTDLAEYLVTPTDGRAVTQWPNRDEAFLDVITSIRRAINEIGTEEKPQPVQYDMEQSASEAATGTMPRSSNLRLRKEFTQADKDRFLEDTFEFIDKYFQGSLSELEARNEGIETRYRRIDGNAFTATIYRNGRKASACGIRLGGGFGNGISYSQGDDAPTNSMNENLSVEHDDQKMFLRPLGMRSYVSGLDNKSFSQEGAAEYYWSMLIEPLQGN